ncbi:unnamed protein product [Thlaspi arvense]|uniref:Uncharacterized protein n=1 Tax=Thlaspi arvense TaxID=13288 RepID=A0AAU9SM82_THLAR|nr:unnamed protein product [Thlaspi arvense]
MYGVHSIGGILTCMGTLEMYIESIVSLRPDCNIPNTVDILMQSLGSNLKEVMNSKISYWRGIHIEILSNFGKRGFPVECVCGGQVLDIQNFDVYNFLKFITYASFVIMNLI